MRKAIVGYGVNLGPTRGHIAPRTWVIRKGFEVLLALPAQTISASWRKVDLEHPAQRQDYIVEVDDEQD